MYMYSGKNPNTYTLTINGLNILLLIICIQKLQYINII